MADVIERFAVVYEEHSHESIWLIGSLAPRVDISTKASVVPVPANPPNWRSSICGVITSSTQSSTMDIEE